MERRSTRLNNTANQNTETFPENQAEQYIRLKKDKDGFVVRYIDDTIGKGVFAERSFSKGEFLLEYDGDLVSNKEGTRRLEEHSNTFGCYVFFFKYGGKSLSIDATFSKQMGRFVNDGVGADENALMKRIVVDGSPHLVLFARRDIYIGDEIRYDYGDVSRNLPWRKRPQTDEKKNTTLKECCVSIRRLEIKDDSHKVACNREAYSDSDSDIENLTRKHRVLKLPSDDEDEEKQELDLSNENKQVLNQPPEDEEVGSNIGVREVLIQPLEDEEEGSNIEVEEEKSEGETEKLFVCALCDKKLRSRESFLSHMGVHFTDNVKRMLPKSNDTTEHIPAQIEMNSQETASCSEGPKKDRGPPLKSSMVGLDAGDASQNESYSKDGDNIERISPAFNDTSIRIPAQNKMNCQETASCSEGPKKARGRPVKSSTGEKSKSTRSKPYRPCPFCGLLMARLSNHILRKHKDIPEVKVLKRLPHQDQVKQMANLRKEGIWKANLDQVKKMEDEGSQAEVKYFKEREHGAGQLAYCSLCKGFLTKSYYKRHRSTCTAVESTTTTAKALDPVHIASPKFTSSFNFDVLAKFHNSEVGNLCRTDNLITSFGLQMYRNVEAKKSKKEEKRKSVMSDMRRLAHLLLEFRKQCEINGDAEAKSAVNMFDRGNFHSLESSILALTINEETGHTKAGLKIGYGYLIKRVIKYLTGEFLIQKKDAEVDEIKRFGDLLEFCWPGIFGDAEYKITVLRQKELRMPSRLPDEDDVKMLKEWLENKIKDIKTKFQFITSNEYAEIRDLLVCRLTLFNARRGGEPARLLLSEWDDAENGVWFSQDSVEKVEDPIEQKLLCELKIAYQAGKRKLVSLLIPQDCWDAIRILADEKVRDDAGIGKGNKFLFPTTAGKDEHVIGWSCVKKCCKKARLSKDITATDMRHRAATLYAAMDIPEKERRLFYLHMGHSADMNRDVYQCPESVRITTSVGKALQCLDRGNMKASSSKVAETGPKNPEITFSLKDFLNELVDDNVAVRAISGKGLIEEDEVEQRPEKIRAASCMKDLMLQDAAKEYFTDDAWLAAESVFDLLPDCSDDESERSHMILNTTDVSDIRDCEDEPCSSNDSMISGDTEEQVERRTNKRKSSTYDDNKATKLQKVPTEPEAEKGKSSTYDDNKAAKLQKVPTKPEAEKGTKRKYKLWTEENTKVVDVYFKRYITDTSSLDNKGSLPGSKDVREFLQKHPILQDIEIKKRITAIKTKIFNDRKVYREKISKKLKKTLQSM
ncbi:uncharacterized protein LOC134683344 isoform X2 [Mytilus trossulus]|uniref:uncharacterized protein LOC134683344 isoform X2 n=1 Tax=Mytilus trossulus TaxID=6551 RepID=UPI0030050F36